jgi:hypothetical protein
VCNRSVLAWRQLLRPQKSQPRNDAGEIFKTAAAEIARKTVSAARAPLAIPGDDPARHARLSAPKVDGQPGIGFEDRIKSLAIEEAYRPITIREGDRVERVPIIQAILRKVAVAAANGNTRAQQNYLTLLIGAEADRRMATTEHFASAVEYKEHWGRVLAERAHSGATGPEPVPHPDDVLIDSETGNIQIDGPVLEDQKQARDQLRAMWPELERELMGINAQIESDPRNSELRKQQRNLAKIVGWLRDDAQKRTTRDALRFTGRLMPDDKADWKPMRGRWYGAARLWLRSRQPERAPSSAAPRSSSALPMP